MGYGDEILATGMARGTKAHGKRIAFGDGKRIIWGPWAEPVFRHNENIAPPGSEGADDLEWIAHYKGHRLYNRHARGRWIWNEDFRAVPGEFFFTDTEKAYAQRHGDGFVLIEPTLPAKDVAVNKYWPFARYQRVADALRAEGYHVAQFVHDGVAVERRLHGAAPIGTKDFRDAVALLAHAALYIGPEGGLHHAAAAVNIRAVVLFGGFIPPSVTGYDMHVNLTGGAAACGRRFRCEHCRQAMDAIKVGDVTAAALRILRGNEQVAA